MAPQHGEATGSDGNKTQSKGVLDMLESVDLERLGSLDLEKLESLENIRRSFRIHSMRSSVATIAPKTLGYIPKLEKFKGRRSTQDVENFLWGCNDVKHGNDAIETWVEFQAEFKEQFNPDLSKEDGFFTFMDGLKSWVKNKLRRRGVKELSIALTMTESIIELGVKKVDSKPTPKFQDNSGDRERESKSKKDLSCTGKPSNGKNLDKKDKQIIQCYNCKGQGYLVSGYYQVRIAKEDESKIACVTRFGSYKYLLMLFGFTNAPATFYTLMNKVLQLFLDRFIVVYLDDILIYIKTLDEYIEYLKQVFLVLRENELFVKEEKCLFSKTKVLFLGHILEVARSGWIGTRFEPLTNGLRKELMKEFHDSKWARHPGIHRTLALIAEHYYWLHLGNDVEAYVKTCLMYQQDKIEKRRPTGLLQPMPIPEKPWESLSMDFIVDLPIFNRFSSIMFVIDRFSKHGSFILASKVCPVKVVACVFLKYVVKYWGVLKMIISDRDTTFIGRFWKGLFKLMGSGLNFSISIHPLTDGQTERVNALVETYLRYKGLNPTIYQFANEWQEQTELARACLHKVGTMAYRLELPSTIRAQPVLHVSLLKPYHQDENEPYRGKSY
ncbi:hypothetical protein F3Y22_tig00113145pilonHSYRG00081 [Hibiscus syriacus]|uniref:Integrase catalytic domain-containing protein n=1 Tax=Hibiscus syriacus TaxID=106335 RepID=A0A6A2WPP1_HIBSY|nr:hypothetical protein F3Y22_tig00113145pilonHSYRG00081 [Hibiscus syriacus]